MPKTKENVIIGLVDRVRDSNTDFFNKELLNNLQKSQRKLIHLSSRWL